MIRQKRSLKAIELDSDETDYYYDLGYLYEYGLNESEKAIAQYLKILDFDPEDRKLTVLHMFMKINLKTLKRQRNTI